MPPRDRQPTTLQRLLSSDFGRLNPALAQRLAAEAAPRGRQSPVETGTHQQPELADA